MRTLIVVVLMLPDRDDLGTIHGVVPILVARGDEPLLISVNDLQTEKNGGSYHHQDGGGVGYVFVVVVGVTTSGIVVVDDVDGLPWQRGLCGILLVTDLRHNDNNDAAGVGYRMYFTVWTKEQGLK